MLVSPIPSPTRSTPPLIRDPVYGFQTVNVASQQADEGSLLHLVRKMIAARKGLPLLAKGKLEWLLDTPKGTLCFVRSEGDQQIVVLHNLSDETYTIPLTEWTALVDVFDPDARSANMSTLPPYGYRWLKVEIKRE